MQKLIKIGFSFNLSNGGPSNFLKKLSYSLRKLKIAKTTYFINPFSDINIYANKVRNPWNKPYIFRIDGVGYDKSRLEAEMVKLNSEIIHGINSAKGVVYQSEHSKKLAEQILKIKPIDSTVIINGTDLLQFNVKGDNLRSQLNISEDALVFISSAKWRKQKRLEDILNVFDKFKEQYTKEIFLIIIGDKEGVDEKKNIIYIPFVPNEELPKYLRTADIYLFFSWLDNCPNSVIESVACGTPVICTNQGGTKEIINLTNGGIIVDADLPFNYQFTDLQNVPKPDYNKLLSAIEEMVNNLSFYKERINNKPINIDFVAKQYLTFIENIS